MKRCIDIVLALFALVVLSPILVPVCFLVWWQDKHSPFYIAARAGRGGSSFNMVKVRSMIKGADKTGVESTSANDNRITPLGHFIRRYKIDELGQLWNVLKGEMSIVGPRPNTLKAVAGYHADEKALLQELPGITDFSSIVFSDEGDILKNSKDPDADYDRLIRPWKSKLGKLYVEKRGLVIDLRLMFLTALAVINKPAALEKLQSVLASVGADETLCKVARRDRPLESFL